MAGHDNGQRVGGAGAGHGAYCCRLAQPCGQLGITDRLPGRHPGQFGPYLLLKLAAVGNERAVQPQLTERMVEIGPQGLHISGQGCVILNESGGRETALQVGYQQLGIVAQQDRTDPAVTGGEQEAAELAAVDIIEQMEWMAAHGRLLDGVPGHLITAGGDWEMGPDEEQAPPAPRDQIPNCFAMSAVSICQSAAISRSSRSGDMLISPSRSALTSLSGASTRSVWR